MIDFVVVQSESEKDFTERVTALLNDGYTFSFQGAQRAGSTWSYIYFIAYMIKENK